MKEKCINEIVRSGFSKRIHKFLVEFSHNAKIQLKFQFVFYRLASIQRNEKNQLDSIFVCLASSCFEIEIMKKNAKEMNSKRII